jgi:putative transcriptional regulator
MTEEQLLARDARRDIGAELLLSVRQMTARSGKVVFQVQAPSANLARTTSQLSQEKLTNRGERTH